MSSTASSTDNASAFGSVCKHWLTRCGFVALLLSLALVGGCRSSKPGGIFGKLSQHKPRPEANVPPRREVSDEALAEYSSDKSLIDDEVSLTEFKPGQPSAPVELDGATIVARVNSVPIFAEDVLFPFATKLAKAEKSLTPEQSKQLRAEIIHNNLAQHVEKAVLVGALRESMKRDELKKLDEQLEKIWNSEEVPRLLREYKVGTRVELERALEEQGTVIGNLKNAFVSREMAMFYMGQKAKSAPKYGPKELREYYDTHQDEFKIDAMVRWQLLQVNFKPHGGKNGALSVFNEAIVELKGGSEFADVVKKFSDGPRKDEGGIYDWTSEGSLANKQMNRALSDLSVGRISSPIDTGDAWVLIKILERQEAGFKPFEDVQKDLSTRLTADARRLAAENTLKELMENAQIWTIFDRKQPPTK